MTPVRRTEQPLRGLEPTDLYELRWAGDAQLAPDGTELVYVVTAVNAARDGYTAHLWVAPVDGGEPRQFTFGACEDRVPRWSPDGSRLLFISNRSGKKQLYVIERRGGEARQLTTVDGGVSQPVWSPDGRHIAFVTRRAEAETAQQGEEKSDVRVIERLRYKLDGQGWWDGKWSQVFVVEVETGRVRQITSGPYDHTAPAWSPDGKYLVVVADRSPDADYVNRADLWLYALEGRGEPVKLTASQGPVAAPAWSPDGRYIAYVGHDNTYGGATLQRVYLVAAGDPGSTRCVTTDFDRSVLSSVISDMAAFSPGLGLQWSPDGSRIYFTAADGGAVHLFSVEVAAGEVQRELDGERQLLSVHLGRDGRSYAAVVSAPEIPADVFVGRLGASERRVTALNQELLAQRTLSRPKRITFQGAQGREIEGWLLYPVGYDPASGAKVPLILEIHGGPHAAYGWSFFHEFQVLAARGYAVLFTNPHGSQGYGQDFVAATHHDWGGKDYEDVMKAVDHVLATEPIDAQRLGVTGGSYGGYLTNWIIGHTDRFRAAVTQRSTCNRYSQWGTSDVGYFHGRFEFDGNPWDNPEHYLERSPISYVKNIRTPLLIIHSENDLRCPLEQAEQFYTALKWLKKEVQMVIFPNESHGLSRSGQPRHRVERLRRIVDWFDRYLAV